VSDPEILKRAEDKVLAASSFIANAHNELNAFYTRKKRLTGKKSERANRGRRPPPRPPPLNPPPILHKVCMRSCSFYWSIITNRTAKQKACKIRLKTQMLRKLQRKTLADTFLPHPVKQAETVAEKRYTARSW